MKRTTIFADDDLLDEIKEISREENRSVAEIVREAMMGYVAKKRRGKKALSFIGVGSSGKKNIAMKHEGLLWKKDTK